MVVCKMEVQLEYWVHIFARLAPICTLSQCLLTKFLHRSSVRSLLRVRCWLGGEKLLVIELLRFVVFFSFPVSFLRGKRLTAKLLTFQTQGNNNNKKKCSNFQWLRLQISAVVASFVYLTNHTHNIEEKNAMLVWKPTDWDRA